MKDYKIKKMETPCGDIGYGVVRGTVLAPIRSGPEGIAFLIESDSPVKEIYAAAQLPVLPGDDITAIMPLFSARSNSWPLAYGVTTDEREGEPPELIKIRRDGNLLYVYSNLNATDRLSHISYGDKSVMDYERLEKILDKAF